MISQTEDLISTRLEEPKTTILNRDYLVMKPLIDWLRNVTPQYVSGQLVDFGCGNKPYASFFEKKVDKYIGIDLVQNKLGTVDIVLGLNENLPLESDSIDTVISTQVLEHVSEPGRYLREISRVLRKGGYLILTCPGSYMLHEEPHDYFRYTEFGLNHLLNTNGLSIVRLDPAGGAWRLLGQTLLNHITFGRKFTFPILSKLSYRLWPLIINSIAALLDKANTNTKDTVNYMLVAKKV